MIAGEHMHCLHHGRKLRAGRLSPKACSPWLVEASGRHAAQLMFFLCRMWKDECLGVGCQGNGTIIRRMWENSSRVLCFSMSLESYKSRVELCGHV